MNLFKSEEDSLQIKVQFAHKDEVTKPSVSISFSLTDGPVICGIGSFENSIEPIIKNANGLISFHLNKIHLLEGTVRLNSIQNVRRIKIKQKSLKQGFVSLNIVGLIDAE